MVVRGAGAYRAQGTKPGTLGPYIGELGKATMSEKLRESLSAVMDGEADEFELRRVLNEIEQDPELKAVWDRYHEASAVLKREYAIGSGQLRDRVWEALDGGQMGHQDAAATDMVDPDIEARSKRPWWGPATGFAVAATVAIAVVLGTDVFDTRESINPPQVAGTLEGPRFELSNEISANDIQRVNARIMHHVKLNAINRADVSSFAKFLTYEGESSEP